ncbi:hypothetical protein BD310DRAFT_918439 [Dichomitus squalens]|uniref:Uncharacterized protein n=1 Tax=Dichomitus squalens TaxID=114155 RepID=A0A4Q9Q774_9APHY|nr:hypothetical protein BD310DRAFT_918439 [Dichomitus squalens]
MFAIRCRVAFHLLLGFLATQRAASTTHIIDDADTSGAISYTTPQSWSQGAGCTSCWIHPDPSEAFDGTWHDTSHFTTDTDERFITVQFTGTAVSVYNIVANTAAQPNTVTAVNLWFEIDGERVGSGYQHDPSSSTDIEYNVLVFSQDGLSNSPHLLVIHATDGVNTNVLFDRVEYTVPDPPVTTSTTVTTAAPPPPTAKETTVVTSVITTTGSTGLVVTTQSITDTLFSSRASAAPSGLSSSTASTSSVSAPSSTPSKTSPVSSSTRFSATATTTTPDAASSSVAAVAVTTSKRSPPTGLIAGAVVGGLAIVIFLVFLVLWLHRRARSATHRADMSTIGSSGNMGELLGGASERAYSDVEQSAESSSASRVVHIAPEMLSRALSRTSRDASAGTIYPSNTSPGQNADVPYMPPELAYRHHENIVRSPDAEEKVLLGGYEESESDGISTTQHPLSAAATHTSSIAPRTASTGGGSTLREQVSMLQAEIERLRERQERQEMQGTQRSVVYDDAPPLYDPTSAPRV